MEEEGGEQEIQMVNEPIIYSSTGGAVNSVNGYTGDVVLTTSDLENTSDYQTGSEVESAISQAIGEEVTARQAADNNLQTQIDAITASSDVTDIVGTKAELNNYDTSTLGDNDIIKVLQDESQNDETTYYRWSTTTQSFTLIGEEGPYYTKSAVDQLLNDKQDTLTEGANVQIQNNVISATDTTYSDFTGTDGTAAGTAGLVPAPETTDAGKFLKADGTWAEAGGGGGGETIKTLTTDDYNYPVANPSGVAIWLLPTGSYQCVSGSGVKVYLDNGNSGTNYNGVYIVDASSESNYVKYLYFTTTNANPRFVNITKSTGAADSKLFIPSTVQTTGTSTTDVMSQNATTSMIYVDPNDRSKIRMGASAANNATNGICIGKFSQADSTATAGIAIGSATSSTYKTIASAGTSIALGYAAQATGIASIALGSYSKTTSKGQIDVSTLATTNTNGYNDSQYRLITGLYDGQSAHDAATKGQLDGRILTNAGAPTTATVGTVGQLLEDTTNGDLYICTAIVPGTDPDPDTYTWEEVGGATIATINSTDWSALWQ